MKLAFTSYENQKKKKKELIEEIKVPFYYAVTKKVSSYKQAVLRQFFIYDFPIYKKVTCKP